MKLLHSKATAEEILLTSACGNSNMFAVATTSALTIYRSTTLTIIASLSLKEERLAQLEEGRNSGFTATSSSTSPAARSSASCRMQGAWSPSGRIFALGLPNGVVLLLDVEEGLLVRRLEPRVLWEQGNQDALCPATGIMKSDTPDSEEAKGADGPVSDVEEDDDDDEEEKAMRLSCDAVLRKPPSLPTSLPVGPIAAMSWVSVPSAETPIAAEGCLPLQATISRSILAEVGTLNVPVTHGTAPAAATTRTTSEKASEATILACISAVDGSVNFVAGGMREVCFLPASVNGVGQSPAEQHPLRDTFVEQFVLPPCLEHSAPTQDRHTAVARAIAGLGHGAISVANVERVMSLLRGGSGSAVSLPAGQLAKGESWSGTKPLELAANTHRGFLVVRGATPTAVTSPHSRNLYELRFGTLLAHLASPAVPVLCRVAEHCRATMCCVLNAQEKWHKRVRHRVWPRLHFPSKIRLVRDAMVRAIVPVTEWEVEQYYNTLDRSALADDLETLPFTLAVLADDIFRVCFKSLDMCVALVGALRERTSNPEHLGVLDAICDRVAGQRRSCAVFMDNIRLECAQTCSLVQFVLQRASLQFDTAEGGSSGGHHRPSTGNDPNGEIPFSYGAEPLPTAKQPLLLAYLESLLRPEASPSTTTESADTATLRDAVNRWYSDLSTLIDRGVHLLTQQAMSSAVSPSPVAVPLPGPDAAEEWLLDLQVPDMVSGAALADRSPSLLIHATQVATCAPYTAAMAAAPYKLCYEASVNGITTAEPSPTPVSAVVEPPSDEEVVTVQLQPDDEALAASLPAAPRPLWYGFLEEDQHVLLLASSATAENEEGMDSVEADGFSLVMVDDEGNIKARDDDDDDDDDEENEEGAEASGENTGGDEGTATGIHIHDSSHMVVGVRGMAVSGGKLQVSMSRARQFCVVAAGNRFVVIDLFAD